MPGALLAAVLAATFELQGGRGRRSAPDAASYTRPMWLAAYFAFVGVLFLTWLAAAAVALARRAPASATFAPTPP